MANTPERFDFAVIGAGIAGASAAAELARAATVLLVEMEAQPGDILDQGFNPASVALGRRRDKAT